MSIIGVGYWKVVDVYTRHSEDIVDNSMVMLSSFLNKWIIERQTRKVMAKLAVAVITVTMAMAMAMAMTMTMTMTMMVIVAVALIVEGVDKVEHGGDLLFFLYGANHGLIVLFCLKIKLCPEQGHCCFLWRHGWKSCCCVLLYIILYIVLVLS